MNYKTTISIEGKSIDTLSDILPEKGKLKVLFIAKTPALKSVEIGHYFQGRQGKAFWNKLSEFGILNIPSGDFEDNYLLANNFGLTDIVKVPRNFGNEPSQKEYQDGLSRILNLITSHQPLVLIFIYKKVLDNILELGFKIKQKSTYGFNPELEKIFNSKVFVFPMPGTPCNSEYGRNAMQELKELLL